MEFGRIVGNLQQIEKDRAARMTSVLEKRLQVGCYSDTSHPSQRRTYLGFALQIRLQLIQTSQENYSVHLLAEKARIWRLPALSGLLYSCLGTYNEIKL